MFHGFFCDSGSNQLRPMSKIVSNMQAAGCINPDASQDLMFFLFYGTKFLEKKTNRNSGDIRFAIPKKRAAISINRFNLPMLLLGSSNGAQVRKPKKCDASILTTTSPIGGMIFFPTFLGSNRSFFPGFGLNKNLRNQQIYILPKVVRWSCLLDSWNQQIEIEW